ncbi:hypothetical protein M0802_004340 [Mischocyttarus mexicanus]|nr:hypothetical protein M0802_004340 [Mischocyttarus mexicanus]
MRTKVPEEFFLFHRVKGTRSRTLWREKNRDERRRLVGWECGKVAKGGGVRIEVSRVVRLGKGVVIGIAQK